MTRASEHKSLLIARRNKLPESAKGDRSEFFMKFDYLTHNIPLELGISFARRGSIAIAIRIDRANALKVASIIW